MKDGGSKGVLMKMEEKKYSQQKRKDLECSVLRKRNRSIQGIPIGPQMTIAEKAEELKAATKPEIQNKVTRVH